jgi:hypothetical protein
MQQQLQQWQVKGAARIALQQSCTASHVRIKELDAAVAEDAQQMRRLTERLAAAERAAAGAVAMGTRSRTEVPATVMCTSLA